MAGTEACLPNRVEAVMVEEAQAEAGRRISVHVFTARGSGWRLRSPRS